MGERLRPVFLNFVNKTLQPQVKNEPPKLVTGPDFDEVRKQNLDKLYQRDKIVEKPDTKDDGLPQSGEIYPLTPEQPFRQSPFESGLLNHIDYSLGIKVKKPDKT